MALAAVVARPTDQDTDEFDLVAGVRAGDDRAFELLYLRYRGRIAAYVGSMVHDHGRAEDITQEVFISALRRMRETDRPIAFKPWVYEIAKNACIDAFRRSRNRNEVSFDAEDALGAGDHDRLACMGATPDSAIDTKVDLDNLRGALGGLSELHHQILVMRELEGLSYRDIGARLGMSRPAVESTLFRARRRLGEEWNELVSGKRCLRVRAIVDARGHSAGARDQRRMDRHISHCQPCRRYALAAGVDLRGRSLRPAAARIAALLPLPGQATFGHWSANVAGGADPGTLAGWSKAVVAAATVAVAGVGAGAAITEREALHDFISRAPAITGFGDSALPAQGDPGVRHDEDATPAPAARRAARRAGRSERAARSDGTSPTGTGARHRSRTTGGTVGGPTASDTPQGGASQRGGAQGADPLRPVGDLLKGALGAHPGGGASAAGSSKTVANVTATAGHLSGATGNVLSGVTSAADAAARSTATRPAGAVGPVTSTITTTAGVALPGR